MISTITIGATTIGALSSGYIFDKLTGFDFPKTNVTMRDRGHYHGARLGNYNYGRREFTIEGTIYGDTESDFETKRRALQQVLDLYNGTQTILITTKSGLTLQADAIVKTELGQPYEKNKVFMGTFFINMVAAFPYLLSQTLNSEDVAVADGGGGAIPATIPFSLGTGGTGATTVANDGNAYAFPTIKIYGVIENPSVQNVTTGKQCALTYTLSSSGDYIEIDTYNRTVLLNGVTNIRQYFSGDWLTLAPGDNDLKLSSASYGGSALANFEYRDSYLGI